MPQIPSFSPGQWFLISVAAVWCFLMAFRRLTFLFSMAILPGTVLHEASHLLAGLVFFGGPKDFSVWPKVKEGYYYHGSIRFVNTHWWNRPFLGLAPLSLLALVWVIFRYQPEIAATRTSALWWPLVYLTAVLLFSSVPSTADLRVAAENWVWGVLGCVAGLGILVVILVPDARVKVIKMSKPAYAVIQQHARHTWRHL